MKPILISHRGNITGPNPEMENKPEYIDVAIEAGYDVEIDVWANIQPKENITAKGIEVRLFLGHDKPEYEISFMWLYCRKNFLWVHTKNFFALTHLIVRDLKLFFHEQEKHTVIANTRKIWSHDLEEAGDTSIIPLLSKADIAKWEPKPVFGICSDYVELLKQKQ